VRRKDAGRIAAETEEGGMAEGDEATQAEREVETGRRQRQDGDTGCERHVERLAEGIGCEREGKQQSSQDEVDDVFAGQHRSLTHGLRGRARAASQPG